MKDQETIQILAEFMGLIYVTYNKYDSISERFFNLYTVKDGDWVVIEPIQNIEEYPNYGYKIIWTPETNPLNCPIKLREVYEKFKKEFPDRIRMNTEDANGAECMISCLGIEPIIVENIDPLRAECEAIAEVLKGRKNG